MVDFLQSYGIWIGLGLFFLLMLRSHRHGGGCGMSHGSREEHHNSEQTGTDKRNTGTGCH